MKYRDENGVFQDLYLPPTGDTLPIGTVVEYSGTTIPYGWESYSTGKIRKTTQTVGVVGTVADEYTEDTRAVYNAPYINDCNKYSTDEVFTGKYWIDGKKIYRKTYSLGSWGLYSTGFASGEISVKRIYGYATNGNITVPVPSYQDNWNVKVAILSSGTTIECTDGGARPAYNEMCVTIEYTKTTD